MSTTTTSPDASSSIASTIASSIASALSTDAASATLAPPFVPLVLYNNTPSETGGDSLTEDLTIFYDVSQADRRQACD